MTRPAIWLLALTLLVSGSLASVDTDYLYDEEAEEEVATHVPKFSVEPQTFDVMIGDSVRLPCLIDKSVGAIVWTFDTGSEKKVYFTGPISSADKRFKLEANDMKGNTLVIDNLQAGDSGTYSCKVHDSPEGTLSHIVNVKYAPVVETTPESGELVIGEGSPAKLNCAAHGNPTPTVTWTRKDGLLPGGKKKMEGTVMVISSVERPDTGTYTCTVDNGIGDAFIKNFRLEVNFVPMIDVDTKTVHSGDGHKAQLICNVHGEPMPKVSWSRMGGADLDKVRHRQEQEGAKNSLTIDEVHDSDLGSYTCTARSDLGTAAAAIELTGLPKEVMITSPPHGQEKNSYTLRWNVESYAPIEEYKVIYKIAQTNSSSPKQKWEQIAVPAPSKDGSTVMYSHMHVLSDLEAATEYEAVVTAKNKHGWSQEPAQPFKLYTLGAPALGSTDPNAASSVRSGAMAVVAALGALLAIL